VKENKKPQRIAKIKTFASLPAEWPQDFLPEINKRILHSGHKVVVLDDDPTGTQTVHGIPVLTGWSVDELEAELANDLQTFYLLTNSRSYTLEHAQSISTEIGRNLMEAARKSNRQFVVVSRSDSTLRGHFPGEVDALAKGLAQNFDAWIVIPFFLEGGRYTIEDIHYVDEEGWLVPTAETEFAKDHAFGYKSSNLCQWVEEKTGGRITSEKVVSLSIKDIREGGPELVASSLAQLHSGCVCIVNAVSYRDLEVFVLGLLEAEKRGKKFLYRTAASFVRVRSGLFARPLLSSSDLDLPNSGGGLIVVGSYVPKTTNQVNKLLSHPEINKIEIRVTALLDEKKTRDEIDRVAKKVNQALRSGKDTVIYTSRKSVIGKDAKSSLSIGKKISKGIIACLQKISIRPRFIITKGGITSSDVATEALKVKRAMVCGQILPGVPVWKLGSESCYPELVHIVFPGNVGDSGSLVDIITKLKFNQ
jgi:uncharacterized protein YgbK (DUF1537 family)